MEHFLNPRELTKTLGEYGVRYVMVIVPNEQSILRKNLGKYWWLWDPPRHLQHFNKKSLKTLMENSGYEIKMLRTYGFDDCTIVWLSF